MNRILIILIIHFAICIIYFSINIKFRGLQDSIYRFVVVFMLPVIGFLFFIVTTISGKFAKNTDNILESYLKYIQDKKHVYYEENIDFEKEINTIPFQDSLYFSDNKDKRAYLIYILKKDFIKHIKGLQKAIESDDSETSHYAAAALMEIKKHFEILIQNASEYYYKNSNDINSMVEYAGVLKKYLKSGIADKIDYREYLDKYSMVLEKILLKYHENENYFSEKISTDIELGNFESAYEFCKKFFDYFPNNEKPYLVLLKLYHAIHDFSSFEKKLRELKNKKITLTEYANDMIRFWEKTSLYVH